MQAGRNTYNPDYSSALLRGDMVVHYYLDERDSTIIRLVLDGQWTWAEYFVVLEQILTHVRSKDTMFDCIVEGRMGFPGGSALSQLNHVVRQLPPNIGVIVVVTSNSFVRTINQILFQISKRAQSIGSVADTIDQAYAIISARRIERSVSSSSG